MILAITGVNGNLGGKLVAALRPDYTLRCFDVRGGQDSIAADLASYADSWARHLEGVDTVLHFAGESQPTASWAAAQRGNIVATANVLRAARTYRVRRIVFASSNQVMGGYRFSEQVITTELPPTPLNPYAVTKLFCEEAGRTFASETGISFIALRIGNTQAGENIPHPGMGLGLWGQLMWLSNRDFIDGVRCAIAVRNMPFAIVNVVSNNVGMRWDLKYTQRVLGFTPQDGFTPNLSPEDKAEEEMARRAQLVPGQWLDQRFKPLRG
jgi:nucleoside-diphosphate-sugar epimerase